jgi:hypothetical protein
MPPITGRGQTVAWSPDASAVAYTTPTGLRFYLAGVANTARRLTSTWKAAPS